MANADNRKTTNVNRLTTNTAHISPRTDEPPRMNVSNHSQDSDLGTVTEFYIYCFTVFTFNIKR